jgi:formylglycine-generating enzyme required for sulfatase activity
VSGVPKNCNDNNPCTKDECQIGNCAFSMLPDDVVCQGGKPGGFTLIPGSEFYMGCNEVKDKQCQEDEKPQHQHHISSFRMLAMEVMVLQYQRCVEVGACSTPAKGNDSDKRCNWDSGRLDHPINCVSWKQAQAYCNFLGGRLPTEAEWEKAARGGCDKVPAGAGCADSMPTWPWGEAAPSCDYAVMQGCTAEETASILATIEKSKGMSPYYIGAMAGNVAEWTQDWYGADYYNGSPFDDPKGPSAGAAHVVRGGSAWEGANALRAGNRSIFDDKAFSDYPFAVGIRCVLPGEG